MCLQPSISCGSCPPVQHHHHLLSWLVSDSYLCCLCVCLPVFKPIPTPGPLHSNFLLRLKEPLLISTFTSSLRLSTSPSKRLLVTRTISVKPHLVSSFMSSDTFHFLALMNLFHICKCLLICLRSLFFSRPHVPQTQGPCLSPKFIPQVLAWHRVRIQQFICE